MFMKITENELFISVKGILYQAVVNGNSFVSFKFYSSLFSDKTTLNGFLHKQNEGAITNMMD